VSYCFEFSAVRTQYKIKLGLCLHHGGRVIEYFAALCDIFYKLIVLKFFL
jgi:hypothetical protein